MARASQKILPYKIARSYNGTIHTTSSGENLEKDADNDSVVMSSSAYRTEADYGGTSVSPGAVYVYFDPASVTKDGTRNFRVNSVRVKVKTPYQFSGYNDLLVQVYQYSSKGSAYGDKLIEVNYDSSEENRIKVITFTFSLEDSSIMEEGFMVRVLTYGYYSISYYGADATVEWDTDVSRVEIINENGEYETVIDLTELTVTEDTLLSGYTARNALGALIVGELDPGGGLPSGIKAADFGTVTVTSSAEKVVSHNLGETPDMVMVWSNGNIAAANQILMSVRSSQMAYRSSAYACFVLYHANNSTTTVSMANTNSTTSGVCNFTDTTFSLRTYSSYYWSTGTQRNFNWIALKFN